MKRALILCLLFPILILFNSCKYENPYIHVTIDQIIDAIESDDYTYNTQHVAIEGYLRLSYHEYVCTLYNSCRELTNNFPDTKQFIFDDGFACTQNLNVGIYESSDEKALGLSVYISSLDIDLAEYDRLKSPGETSCNSAELMNYPILISGTLNYRFINNCNYMLGFRSCTVSVDQRTINEINDQLVCNNSIQ